jgi:hypothetical protein
MRAAISGVCLRKISFRAKTTESLSSGELVLAGGRLGTAVLSPLRIRLGS